MATNTTSSAPGGGSSKQQQGNDAPVDPDSTQQATGGDDAMPPAPLVGGEDEGSAHNGGGDSSDDSDSDCDYENRMAAECAQLHAHTSQVGWFSCCTRVWYDRDVNCHAQCLLIYLWRQAERERKTQTQQPRSVQAEADATLLPGRALCFKHQSNVTVQQSLTPVQLGVAGLQVVGRDVLFRGLRVRMSVATGGIDAVRLHSVTQRAEYVGEVLRKVQAVGETPQGGQVRMG